MSANNPLADDGFGNLISAIPQPECTTSVFARIGGRLARWEVATGNPIRAIDTVRGELQPRIRPVLALIEGGKTR
jgi:hypothetical protein